MAMTLEHPAADRHPRRPFWERLSEMRALARQRRDLGQLDARLLDIGVSAKEARAEAARMSWDAPRHWYG